MPDDNEVVITSLACKTNAGASTLENQRSVYRSQTDTVVRIPNSRWDHDLYYTAGGWEDSSSGKATVQHAGFVNDGDCFSFDAKFFGYTDEQADKMPRSYYMDMEVSYECFHGAGYTMDTLKGKAIDLYFGTCQRDIEAAAKYFGCIEGPLADWTDHHIDT